MSFSPRFQDDLAPGFQFQFKDDNDNIVSISGLNLSTAFTVILTPTPGVDQPGVARIVGGGSFSYQTDGSDGKVNYSPITADAHVPGQYLVYCVVILTGNKPMTSDAIPLLIKPKP